MKTRSRVIFILAIIGVFLFGTINFVIIPRIDQRNKQYIAEQQSPITHDLSSILKYENKYMGNSSNLINLFNNLPLGNIKMNFELFPEKLTAQINYKDSIEKVEATEIKKALIYNSTAAFALIDNLKEIDYKIINSTYKVSRSDVEKWYGENLKDLLDKDIWKAKVQDKLKAEEYINKCADELLKKE